MGTQLPLPKKGAEPPPNLQPMTIVAKRLDQQMALGMEVGLGPGHIVLDGHPAPLPKNEAKPLIFCPFLLWPTAGCIKMPLGMEVDLIPGDFVLDGDPAPSLKRGGAPYFWPTSIVAKRLHGSRCHLLRRLRLAQATLC